jgi:hypothetical protein
MGHRRRRFRRKTHHAVLEATSWTGRSHVESAWLRAAPQSGKPLANAVGRKRRQKFAAHVFLTLDDDTTPTINKREAVTHRAMLSIAVPIMISECITPLLGVVDTGVMGGFRSSVHRTVALGSLVFNFVFWGFGFLHGRYRSHRPGAGWSDATKSRPSDAPSSSPSP